MKVVLVAPNWEVKGMDQAMRSPPLGLLYIAGAIPEHDVRVIDLKATDMTPEEMVPELEGAQILGMTLMTSMLPYGEPYLAKAKEMGLTTVVGGYHPTLCPEIAKSPSIDIAVQGEGEITFREICEGKPWEEIKGIAFKKDGKLVINERRPLLENLDDLPMPRKDLLDMSKYQYLYNDADVIESTRGCPYQCNFCCITNFYGNSYRMKSAERVVKEIEHVDPKKKLIFFVDDNLTQNMKRMDRICDLLKEKPEIKFLYAGQARVDSVCRHPEIIQKMADVGFVCLFLGIESIHQKSLTIMGKKTSSEQIKKAIDIMHNCGMLAYGSFIVGNVGETREDIKATVEFMRNSGLDVMQATPITPYPGTPLYHQALENGWCKERWWEDWDLRAVMDTPDLTRVEIHELFQYTMRRFYYNMSWYMSLKKWKLIFSDKMRWWWKVAPKFFAKGATNFIFRLGS